ncbi:MAG TPA: hypothetical protein VLX68_02555 [Chitinivibrionales bacterium]|nr:hypothetical protein [Chitinivibrionales bacterium]
MKKLVALTVALTLLAMMAGCVSKLIYSKTLPEIKAPADKALCVIIRPTAFMGSTYVPVYCDTKYVGGTEGNTLLTFPVDPGEHYIIGDATNKSKAKFNFQAGKVYFIFHTVVTVTAGYVTINTSTFASSDGPSAMKKIEDEKGKITWVQKNPEDKDSKDMSTKDFDEVKKDYAKWAAESKNAEEAKTEAEYPGY